MITLVHFNLRDPIMVGKKKTSDVQVHDLFPSTTLEFIVLFDV